MNWTPLYIFIYIALVVASICIIVWGFAFTSAYICVILKNILDIAKAWKVRRFYIMAPPTDELPDISEENFERQLLGR